MDEAFRELKARLHASPGKPLTLMGFELREAAVLVPLLLRAGVPYLLFTKRPMTLRSHAGQISFPGGGRDPQDSTPLHTALRETEEELGLPPERVEVLGVLDEIPTITGYRVTPFVGVIPPDFRYTPSAVEIEEVIEAPVPALLDPAIHRAERRWVLEEEREVYFYDFGPHVIWGATARILRGLLALARDLPPFARGVG